MWLGICPIDDQTKRFKQLLYKLFGWLAVLILALTVVSSGMSTFSIGRADLNNALYAAFPVFACIRVSVCLMLMILFRQNVTLFLEKLQAFYDQSKLPSSQYFLKINLKLF